MDPNPYQSPQTESPPRLYTASRAKRTLFWIVAILALPVALVIALSSLCFGFVSLAFLRGSESATLLLIAVVLAAVAVGLFWGWWQVLKRLRK